MVHLAEDRTEHVHFENAYKHLGTFFTTQHAFTVELSHRIGVAAATFGQLSRPLLCNKRLPIKLRLRLFFALVGSRLSFGLGAWHTLPIRQMERLRKVLVGFLRRVLRIPYTAMVTNAEVLRRAGTGDVRARLAVDRLNFAQKLFTVAPEAIQRIILQEPAYCTDAWLDGLKADIDWLALNLPAAVPQPWNGDFTEIFEFWQQTPKPWKRIISKAWKLHCQQEHMMADIHHLHHQIFHILRQAGSAFQPDPEAMTERGESHICHCHRVFSSAQGLSLRKKKAHGEFSLERQFVQGATCSVCLKHFWCSARLQQHLAYIPRKQGYNSCFAELLRRGDAPGYEAAQRPTIFAGLNRLDACHAEGPAPMFQGAETARAASLQADLDDLCRQLWAFEWPDQAEPLGSKIADALTLACRLWFADFRRHQHDRRFEPTQRLQILILC